MKGTPPTNDELLLLATKWGAAWINPIMSDVVAMDAEEELRATKPDLVNLSPKDTANLLLGNAQVLRSMSDKQRFGVLSELFNHFDLPPGWRHIALEGGITEAQLIGNIMQRVQVIDSVEKGVAEENFLDQLFTRPRHPQDAYGPLMSLEQRQVVARIVEQFAPNVFRRHQAETMGWRHGRLA